MQTRFAYWVEKSLLSAYRWTVFEKTIAECATEEEALARLSDDSIRREAGHGTNGSYASSTGMFPA